MAMTNYIDFMRKVEGKPERVVPVTPLPEYTYSGARRTVHCGYLRDVLDGHYGLLADSFAWVHTPQGYDYWCNRSNNEETLSSEDEQYLLWMIREYS
jgi:hypothetical protein